MNNEGVFELVDGRAMSLKTVAAFARCDYPTLYKMVIQLVELSLLKKREDTGAYYIPNWNYYQNGAAFRKIKERERKQKARAKTGIKLTVVTCLPGRGPEERFQQPESTPLILQYRAINDTPALLLNLSHLTIQRIKYSSTMENPK